MALLVGLSGTCGPIQAGTFVDGIIYCLWPGVMRDVCVGVGMWEGGM